MPTTENRNVTFNDDRSIYIHPPVAGGTPPPTGTPPPVIPPSTGQPVGDAIKVEFPGLGPHPVVRMEPRQPYYVLIPYAENVMAVQAAGTFEDTVTDLELTGAPTPGDRNWWNTAEATVTTPSRDPRQPPTVSKPARSYGDAHGPGVRLSWSPNGSANDFKRPNDGRPWAVTLYSEKGGSVEFFVQGA